MKQVFDRFRNRWVDATAEEIVRQRCLRKMVQQLGYSRHSLAIERELSQIVSTNIGDERILPPKRRVDVLCFRKCRPLLLIECKSVVSLRAMDQACAYNQFVRAPYVAVVGEDGVLFRIDLDCWNQMEEELQLRSSLWFGNGGKTTLDSLPIYEEL